MGYPIVATIQFQSNGVSQEGCEAGVRSFGIQFNLESYPLAKSECEYTKHPGEDFLNKLSHLNLESIQTSRLYDISCCKLKIARSNTFFKSSVI